MSGESWEAAARNAVETAAKSVRDLRIAEVLRQEIFGPVGLNQGMSYVTGSVAWVAIVKHL